MQEFLKQVKRALKAFWRAPLWLVIVGAAAIGIFFLSVWPSLTAQLILINILAVVVFVRLLAAKGIFAWIVKASVVIWILLYWFAKLTGH